MDWLKEKASAAASYVKQKTGMEGSPITDGDQLSKAMGAPTVPGTTITGGRRYRKKTAKRHSKKHKKTLRRKH